MGFLQVIPNEVVHITKKSRALYLNTMQSKSHLFAKVEQLILSEKAVVIKRKCTVLNSTYTTVQCIKHHLYNAVHCVKHHLYNAVHRVKQQ